MCVRIMSRQQAEAQLRVGLVETSVDMRAEMENLGGQAE